MPDRLTALDSSFLEIESPTAHMHVGWACLFSPPPEGPPPDFGAVRDHIATRMGRAPRYRQRVEQVPLGLGNPVWVDDPDFSVDRHVRHAPGGDFGAAIDEALSTPLPNDRPLWEIRVADALPDGRVGIIGKAHHCMVDGIAAVELMALLLDPTVEPPDPEDDGWRPEPLPGSVALLAQGMRARLEAAVHFAGEGLRTFTSPRRALALPGRALRAWRALVHTAVPAPGTEALEAPLSPDRHLAVARRSLDDLRQIRTRFGTTVNDVVLAAAAAGLRGAMHGRDEPAPPLKAMVPVNVRSGEAADMGNRISFVFVELPCQEPDPVRRLERVREAMRRRKRAGEPEGGDELLRALEYTPRAVQRFVSQLMASPRAFNVTVSNIPGPAFSLYMLGCELESAHPVVPLPERHDVSIGMTSIAGDACFGVYGDPESDLDADAVARGIESSIEEMLAAGR